MRSRGPIERTGQFGQGAPAITVRQTPDVDATIGWGAAGSRRRPDDHAIARISKPARDEPRVVGDAALLRRIFPRQHVPLER
jgi:hypothetical protein